MSIEFHSEQANFSPAAAGRSDADGAERGGTASSRNRLGRARAIRLAGVSLTGQDRSLRYLWVENPPYGMVAKSFIGRSDEEVFPADIANTILPVKREVLATGIARNTEFQTQTLDGSHWYDLRVAPRFSIKGDVIGLVCATIDITERKHAESHLRILLLELAHRSKNLLAVIQGIANQTAQGLTDVPEFIRRFSGRLMSLARAHDILTDQNWRGAGMRELIRTQVLLFAGSRAAQVSYDGDAVYLRPSAAQHVGLALYELTANALKFGALSVPDGRVSIRWSVDYRAPGRLEFRWIETGAPAPTPGERHFGLVLLEDVVPSAVQGQAGIAFQPTGVEYSLSMPMSELT